VTVRFVRPTTATEVGPTNSEPEVLAGAAQSFVVSAELAEPPLRVDETETAGLSFDVEKGQAIVVGSQVISFVKGISPAQRTDIVNLSVLAQLVVQKKIGETRSLDDINAWYDAYFEALSSIGFVVQDRNSGMYRAESRDFRAHEEILNVATTILAGSSQALAVVERTLEALRAVPDDSPSIVLFNRASRSAKTSRALVAVVEQDDSKRLRMSLIGLGIEGKSTLTTVLFFKFNRNEVSFRHYSGRLTIDAQVLDAISETVSRKVAQYTGEYVRQLPDL
jgi:hypothetical protein